MSNPSVKFYDRLAFLYPIIDCFLKPQKRKLFRQINACPEGRLLEIGVGNGSHLDYYKKHQVIGIDTSARMLERARRHASASILLCQMSGEELLFSSETFDYVVLSHVIAVVDDREKLMAEVCRVLKPGGKVFILNHFTPNNWLRLADRLASKFSKMLHFESFFPVSAIEDPERKLKLKNEYNAGLLSYFKILVFEKGL